MLWMGDIVLLSQKAYFCSIHTIWWRFFPPSLMVVVFVTLSNHLNFMWIWWFSILICQIVLFIIIHLFLPYYVYWLVWLWFWHFFKLIRYIDWLWLIIDFCHLIWLDWLWNCLRHFHKWQFSIHTIPIMSSINHQTKHNIKKLWHKV